MLIMGTRFIVPHPIAWCGNMEDYRSAAEMDSYPNILDIRLGLDLARQC